MSDPTPSGRLSAEEVLADPLVEDLLEARLVGVLSTFDLAGHIHAVPMWFARVGGAIVLATGSRSRKVANLEGDARATLVVHDSRPGFEVCGVSCVGRVDVVRGEAAQPLVDAVHSRYVDETGELPDEVRVFLGSDDVALRFRPESALTWDERGSGASAVLRAVGAAYPLVTTAPRRSPKPP